MKQNWKLTAAVGVLLLTFAVTVYAISSTASMADKDTIKMEANVNMAKNNLKINRGELAPNFEMMDQRGNIIKLSDFAGQKVYLKYWASWCPICLVGLADINSLSAEASGFKVLTVVAPGSKGEKNIEDFKTWFAGVKNTQNIIVLFDKDGTYGIRAGVRGYPTSAYIGSDGVLVKQAVGHTDNDTIRENFKNID